MQNSVGEERGDDVGGLVGSPEPGQASREFFVLVEITQIQDDLDSVSILRVLGL